MPSYKKRLQLVYKAAEYLGGKAELRSNDLSRDAVMRANDKGLADAYANIALMITREHDIGTADYWKTNKVTKELPYNLR